MKDDVIGRPLTGSRALHGLDRLVTRPVATPLSRPLPDAGHAIYDWNRLNAVSPLVTRTFDLCDETLRDGIQSPSVIDPPIEAKLELMHLMDQLGVGAITVGLPGAGERAYRDSLALTREAARAKLKAQINLSARTVIPDIKPIVDIAQATGVPVNVYTFIGSSPIRMFAEGWTVGTLLSHIESAVSFAVREGLNVCLVTEDTTRARPDVLDPLFRTAINLGAKRLCLCDTVGHATPEGVRSLVSWTKHLMQGMGVDLGLDWHGHNDRGLAVANAVVALEAGADRAHGTGLGLGERVGNAAMDQLMINLKLAGAYEHDLSALNRYCDLVADACGVPIPPNYPVVGRDAFRTATGVHAAAIIKAQRKGDIDYADRVYSGVPASWVGRAQVIEISHMSGGSNVVCWLEERGISPEPELVQDILQRAKTMRRTLETEEIMALVALRSATTDASAPMLQAMPLDEISEATTRVATIN